MTISFFIILLTKHKENRDGSQTASIRVYQKVSLNSRGVSLQLSHYTPKRATWGM